MEFRSLNIIEVTFDLDSNRFFKVAPKTYKSGKHLSDEENEDISPSTQTIRMAHILNIVLLPRTPIVSMHSDEDDNEFVYLFDMGESTWLEKDLLNFCRELELWLDNVKVLKFDDNQQLILSDKVATKAILGLI